MERHGDDDGCTGCATNKSQSFAFLTQQIAGNSTRRWLCLPYYAFHTLAFAPMHYWFRL
jgi:hypothetical protein